MTDRRHQLGAWGEAVAARFLEERGFVILERNVRTRYGELDIVAREGETLVFIEVRTKSHTTFGHPFETIDGRKIRKLQGMARWYLHARRLGEGTACRFDAVAVIGSEERCDIEHLRNVIS
ncbi:MAG TPA: YraN family protein [Candidatus Ozemobacteraceae bacterium]|nr:YraN family protein [Candidatus Ozemobacteraceae bacterium]